MIAAHQHELADSLKAALSQLKLKEEKLQAKERDLKVNADVLAQLYRQWITNGNQVKVTLGELELWRQQAEAIERSHNHLATIDRIIESVKKTMKKDNDFLPTCEVDLVVHKTMLRDQLKFNQLAFGLIAEHNQKQQKLYFDLDE